MPPFTAEDRAGMRRLLDGPTRTLAVPLLLEISSGPSTIVEVLGANRRMLWVRTRGTQDDFWVRQKNVSGVVVDGWQVRRDDVETRLRAALPRTKRPEGTQGERAGGHDQIHEIRRRYAEGGSTQRQLALKFGVSESTIGRVVRQGRKGGRLGPRKLTGNQIHEIRRRYAKGGVTQLELGQEFEVAHSTINEVLRGRRKGGRGGPRKLTNGQAQYISRRYREGGISKAALARKFGVSPSVISSVLRRKGAYAGISIQSFGRKLTGPEIEEIRRRYAKGGVTQLELGREFGVAQSTISEVVGREDYRVPRLTGNQIHEIRRRYGGGGVTQSDLAWEFAVAQTTVSKIVLWKQYLGRAFTDPLFRVSRTRATDELKP